MDTWKNIVGKSFTPDAFEHYVTKELILNQEFGAETPVERWRPQFVVLHNTAIPTLAQWHSVPGEQRMRSLENFYKNEQKWSAGPHLFVADDLIWVFTPLTVSGVHSPSWNSVAWGVEMVGDYNVEAFDPRVRDNAVSALATLHAAIDLKPASLRLHKEDPKTTHDCPGRNVDKADMIQRVSALLSARPGEVLAPLATGS